MSELPRLLLAREHLQLGLTPQQLAARCRAGALMRVRHGVYVDGPAWEALSEWEKYRVRVSAAAETFVAPTVFARHSAASVWGIPTIGYGRPVYALTLKNDGGRSRAGVKRHYAPLAGLDIVERDGLLVTGRIRTVLDLAAYTPFSQAVVAVDHVLRADPSRGLAPVSGVELLAGIEGNYTAAASQRIRAAVDFGDPRSGSAGESYGRALMWAAGFEAPALQYEIRDRSGRVGFSDYFWTEGGIAGEFDGVVKYMKPEYLQGRTASQAVVDEKRREDRMRAAGFSVVRWVWPDLMSPARLERALSAAGVPRRRTRSARRRPD